MGPDEDYWRSREVAALVAAHDVGGLLKAVRRHRRLSQPVLGLTVGRSASTISRIESGKVDPDYRTLARKPTSSGFPPASSARRPPPVGHGCLRSHQSTRPRRIP